MVYYAQKSGHMAACGAACHKKGSAFMPDRIQIKEEAKQVLRGARVNPYLVSLIVVGILGLLGGLDSYVGASRTVDQVAEFYGQQAAAMLPSFPEFPVLLVAFVAAVNWLAQAILSAGWAIYHLGVRRGKEMPFACLLDGFNFLGKLILLNIVMSIFVFLWSLLFYIPGLIAQYRYRFAVYNLCENPDIGIMEAISMSKAQTAGFKWTLFVLDLSFIGWILLSGLTLGILDIWLSPYREQANVGYFQEIKRVKGIGFQSGPDNGGDDPFRPIDPFGPNE